MTHEELLAKINAAGAYALQADSDGWIALRAVVELHKSWNDGDKDICQECANMIDPWDENLYAERYRIVEKTAIEILARNKELTPEYIADVTEYYGLEI